MTPTIGGRRKGRGGIIGRVIIPFQIRAAPARVANVIVVVIGVVVITRSVGVIPRRLRIGRPFGHGHATFRVGMVLDDHLYGTTSTAAMTTTTAVSSNRRFQDGRHGFHRSRRIVGGSGAPIGHGVLGTSLLVKAAGVRLLLLLLVQRKTDRAAILDIHDKPATTATAAIGDEEGRLMGGSFLDYH